MITPMDIQNKAFNKGVRGYREEEVDSFLDLITLDMEKLIDENAQMKQELAKAKAELQRYQGSEGAVLETLEAAKAPAVHADKPGEYSYCYEMQKAPTGCDFAADLAYYGKHYFLRPLRDDLPRLHGRGIDYDEKRNTYTVTLRAYDKLKQQYRISYETCLD